MIAEAVDTLWTLVRAFAVWIVAAAVVVTAALYAVVAVVVLAWRAARWAAKAARSPLSARQTAEHAPHAPSEGRGAHRASGARTDDSSYREAA